MTVPNRDDRVVEGFGREWAAFDQSTLTDGERAELFGQYFQAFPWEALPAGAVGADIGCGSGRWALLAAPRVGVLHCVDPSAQALTVARAALSDLPGARFHCAGVDDLPFEAGSLDFAYSLGVLHHVPDTAEALRACAQVLKPGAPFLVYLYYAFDNQPGWYRRLWLLTEALRRGLSRAPFRVRLAVSAVVAVTVYLPLARTARWLERRGRDVQSFPLSYYRERSVYVMRNDALDRFGTALEQRFTRAQIVDLLTDAGFVDVRFNATAPYWTAVARRAA